jgi:hypothetical protein
MRTMPSVKTEIRYDTPGAVMTLRGFVSGLEAKV